MPSVGSLSFDTITVAAAAAAGSFWRSTHDLVEELDPYTGRRLGVVDVGGVTSAAGSEELLVLAIGTGSVVGVDPSSRRVRFELPESGAVPVASTSDVWLWQRDLGIATRVSPSGGLEDRHVLGAAHLLCGDESRLWWVSGDLALHDSDGRVFAPPIAGIPLAGTVCGGALWLCDGESLAHVSTWGGQSGAPLQSPIGPLEALACSGMRLIGANRSGRVAVLDPASDAGVSVVDAPPVGRPRAAVGDPSVGWVLGADRAVTLSW